MSSLDGPGAEPRRVVAGCDGAQGGAVVARLAHNQEVAGANPAPAPIAGTVAADRYELARLFPLVFTAPRDRSAQKVALKLGIVHDIALRTGWPLDRCRAVLTDYCDGARYLRAVKDGNGWRYDLEGKVAGEVTHDQRQHARRRLKEVEAEYTRDNKMRRKERRREQLDAAAAAPATA